MYLHMKDMTNKEKNIGKVLQSNPLSDQMYSHTDSAHALQDIIPKQVFFL